MAAALYTGLAHEGSYRHDGPIAFLGGEIDMDQSEFRIVSLSYDVHNKKVFGIINQLAGHLSTSINFSFPYRSTVHQTDDELKTDMEKEVRKFLLAAAQFR